MTPVLAALVLTNLLYLAGAVGAASLVSGLYVLRHRKPKSMESGIESFSRELRALAPDHRAGVDHIQPASSMRARPVATAPAPAPISEASPIDEPAGDDGGHSAPGGGSG